MLAGSASFSLQRTKDFRVVGEVSFLIARTREWNQIVRSSKLWNNASQAELDKEIESLLSGGSYEPKIIFETPAKIKEAAESLGESGQWQADIADADHVSTSAEGTAVESDSVVSCQRKC